MLSQKNTWVRKANMPTPQMGHATCVVDGKIYAIGGYQKANAPGLTTVEVFDLATDSWTTKEPMPTGRRGHVVSVVDGKIYAICGLAGGSGALSIVEVYDPTMVTWTSKTNMPGPRAGFSASCVNGKIFVIGGALTIKPPHPAVSTVEMYFPNENKMD